MPKRQSGSDLQKAVRNHFKKLGAKGGKAGKGKAKARSSAQARKAAKTRWNQEARKPGKNKA